MHHPSDRIAHTTAFVTPVVEHWLEREIAQWVAGDRSDHIAHTFNVHPSLLYRPGRTPGSRSGRGLRGGRRPSSLTGAGRRPPHTAPAGWASTCTPGSQRYPRPLQTPGTEHGEREMFYLTTHSTDFIYGYIASDIW